MLRQNLLCAELDVSQCWRRLNNLLHGTVSLNPKQILNCVKPTKSGDGKLTSSPKSLPVRRRFRSRLLFPLPAAFSSPRAWSAALLQWGCSEVSLSPPWCCSGCPASRSTLVQHPDKHMHQHCMTTNSQRNATLIILYYAITHTNTHTSGWSVIVRGETPFPHFRFLAQSVPPPQIF